MPSNSSPVNLGAEGRASLLDFLENAARRGVADGFDYSRDLPGFIADETPRTVPFAAAKGIARQSCRSWARGNGPQNLPGFDAFWAGTCAPYLDSIGENPGDGSIDRPFNGGQCVGIFYTATYSVVTPGIPTRQFTNPGLTGPVSGFSTGVSGPFQRVFINHGGGVTSEIIDTADSAASTIENFVVSRDDSLPDDCGNPDAQYDPAPIPPGLPPLAPITINIPGIGPVDVAIDFNPDGSIRISVPDLGIEVNVPGPGGGGDGGGGGGDNSGIIKTPEPGSPGDSSDTGGGSGGEGGGADGDAPEGKVLTGVRLDILESPPSRSRFTEEVDRGVAYVYMGVPSEGLALEPTGALVRSGQFFFAQRDYLTRHSVRAKFGYNVRVTPYYRDKVE